MAGGAAGDGALGRDKYGRREVVFDAADIFGDVLLCAFGRN